VDTDTTPQAEVQPKRILPTDLKQVMDLKLPLINVIHLFTGTGESYWTGKWRTLAAMGLVDSLLDSGNDGFDNIALEVRKHFTKEPARRCGGFFVGEEQQAVGDPASDSGGQSNHRVSILEEQLRGIRVTTDLIMVALEATPTDSIEDDLDRIGERLHDLVAKVKAESNTSMDILRKKLKVKTGGIEQMWADLGHRPGYRCVVFSEDVLHLALKNELVIERWVANLFEQLPVDTTIVDYDDRLVHVFPQFSTGGDFSVLYSIIVASKHWEDAGEAAVIPRLYLNNEGKIKSPPVEVAVELDIDYTKTDVANPPGDLTPVQTPVPDSGSAIDDASKLPGDPEQAVDSNTSQG
jgi:hypothetical protein